MMDKVKSECSSQTMISVPPFLTKRNLLQTNIFRNRVSAPSYFLSESCASDVRCAPETSIVRTSKPADKEEKMTKAEDRGIKTKQKRSVEHTSWGWTEDEPCSKVSFSSNLGNVKGDGKDSVPVKDDGECVKQSPPDVVNDARRSEDKMVSTDDDAAFVECETNVSSAENDFRDDSPVNYSRLNATVEKEGNRLNPKSTYGDSFSPASSADVLQRFCAGMRHDVSSPFNTTLAFCKTGIKSDNGDPLTRSRHVNPSTSTNTHLKVAPVMKPDRSLDGMFGANVSTTQHHKIRHFKRKLSVPLDSDCFSGDKPCDQVTHNVQRPKRVHKERKPQDVPSLSPLDEDAASRRIRDTNKYNTSKSRSVNVPQAQELGRRSPNFYDVIDCKGKDVEELFNFQSGFETASSGASQASFRSATDHLNRRCLHSDPRRFRSKSPSHLSGTSSLSSSHRNSSLKFDPDVLKSTFSVSLGNDSSLTNKVHSLLTDETLKYSRNTLNSSLNSSADKMGLERKSGKCTDMYRPSQNQIRYDGLPSYELAKENDEYLFQVTSPKDVLMMSLQTFKGLNINDDRSRTDCEKFLGQKSTGEKLNNFIRSRTIFNSVSFVQSESYPRDEVKICDENGFGVDGKEERPKSVLQCIYKSQHF